MNKDNILKLSVEKTAKNSIQHTDSILLPVLFAIVLGTLQLTVITH